MRSPFCSPSPWQRSFKESGAVIPVPQKPFPDFAWRWCEPMPTEGINRPSILLNALRRMRKLELKERGLKYSSEEFHQEMIALESCIDTGDIDPSRRKNKNADPCERNWIRNSGRYWRSLNLIATPSESKAPGLIQLTDFGRQVADGDISQSEFAAITIQTFTLPNPRCMKPEECEPWLLRHIEIQPLALILKVARELSKNGQGWITALELIKVVIPISGTKENDPSVYAREILSYRANPYAYDDWPDCTIRSDKSRDNNWRMAREFLLFLHHYGYLKTNTDVSSHEGNINQRFYYVVSNDQETELLLSNDNPTSDPHSALDFIRENRIAAEIDARKFHLAETRPHQAQFRKDVLRLCGRCLITGCELPEILDVSHIKPHKYGGQEVAENGIMLRAGIHRLFDLNLLRINPVDYTLEVSPSVKQQYGQTINLPSRICIPDYVNPDYLSWRWDNYVGPY